MSESNEFGAGQRVSVQAKWELDQRAVPVLANQVHLTAPAGQVPSGVQLTLGHVNPPFFTGVPNASELERMGELPVVVVGMFYVPIDAARMLRDTLSTVLDDLDSRTEPSDG